MRAAFARMLTEKGDTYVLPVRLDETPLPAELELISYIKYPDWPPARIASMLNDKAWKKIAISWLTPEEMAETIHKGNLSRAFARSFIEASSRLKSKNTKCTYVILGIAVGIWASDSSKDLTSVLEHLVFLFDPISRSFDREHIFKLPPLKGAVRRYLGDGGPFLASDSFIEKIKMELPSYGEDANDDEVQDDASADAPKP